MGHSHPLADAIIAILSLCIDGCRKGTLSTERIRKVVRFGLNLLGVGAEIAQEAAWSSQSSISLNMYSPVPLEYSMFEKTTFILRSSIGSWKCG